MNHKKAFTLIELLVVIAIIAILAAILFPVFAQAKAAAKAIADISNQKQLGTAIYLYTNDADDVMPVSVSDGGGTKDRTYVMAVRMNPYVKTKGVWKDPGNPYQHGGIQHYATENPYGHYMIPPDDVCVGLPHSNDTVYYADVYPPTDYMLNRVLTGYAPTCANSSGWTGGYNYPSANITTGSNGSDGTNGIGPGQPTINSVAKVVMLIDFPFNGKIWPGGSGVNFWGTNFIGLHNNHSNLLFLDSHAKSFDGNAVIPDPNFDDSTGSGCEPANAWYGGTDGGKCWWWWGTQWADAAHQ